MRLLSIDWDYFVEEDPMLDFGHRETTLFLETMWQIRSTRAVFKDGKFALDASGKPEYEHTDFTKLLPFRGHELQVLTLPCFASPYYVANAESHVALLEFVKGDKDIEIVNIDAHHDIHYGEIAGEEDVTTPAHWGKGELKVDCGNWGSYLINRGLVKSWTQIYPKWRIKFPEGHGDILTWARKKLHQHMLVTTRLPNQVVKWKSVDKVFICRSGCWTPPDYDERFNKFCETLGVKGLPVRQVKEEQCIA